MTLTALEIIWIVAAGFVFAALVISSNDIAQHLLYPKQPELQKNLIRIIIMIPVFAVDSYISLVWRKGAFVFTLLRDLYESCTF